MAQGHTELGLDPRQFDCRAHPKGHGAPHTGTRGLSAVSGNELMNAVRSREVAFCLSVCVSHTLSGIPVI